MSDEVEIICLGDTAHIHDLGLKMVRGARVMTTLSATSRSRDLEAAKVQGIVAVRVMRAQTIKQNNLPAPPPRPQIRFAPSTPIPVDPPTFLSPEIDPTQVLLALQSLALEVRSLREELRKVSVAPAAPVPAPQAPAIDSALLALSLSEAVRAALSGLTFSGGGSAVPQSSFASDEERFIPSGIVTGTAKQDIETSRETTRGIDDAETALRNARRRRKEAENG